MLSWIPILGPVIDGIVSIFKGFTSVEIVKAKTQAEVDIAQTQATTSIIEATKNDIPIRIARDIIIFPWAAWAGLIGWDTIVAHHWSYLQWSVPAPPASVAYIPGMVLVFLLGNVGLYIWKGK